MSDARDAGTIEALTRGLRPVRRVMRLRAAVSVALASAALAVAAALAVSPMRPDAGTLLSGPSLFGGVLAGLVLVAVGACVAALAAGRPGRGASARAGAQLLATGIGVGIAAGLVALAAAEDPAHALHGTTPPAADLACLLRGLAVGFAPALVALALVLRGAALRPLHAAAWAGAGAAAAGALAVHLACQADSVRHVMGAHALAPLVGALLALPAGLVLGRWRRRGD